MRKLLVLADRTAVLFLGIAAGAAIGFAFGRSGEKVVVRTVTKPAVRTAGPAAPPAPGKAAPNPALAACPECAAPFQRHLLDAIAAGRPVTVGVFGDSFGDGVWSALYRLLPAQEHFRVLKYSQQSTGFTRYASLNLEDHAQEQLAADGPVDVAVISFGANDTQGVYAGGHAAKLMSPEWQRVIGERVDRFVALMRAKGAMVYWVGLPKMRAASFDDDISAMNDFYTARMKALGVPFIDIKPLTVDAAGEYAPYLPDPVSHERRLLRANDGVHMSMNGYVVISRALAARIKDYVAAARATKPVATAAAAPPPPLAKAVTEPAKREADRPAPRPKQEEAPARPAQPPRQDGDEGRKAPPPPPPQTGKSTDVAKRDSDSDGRPKPDVPAKREGDSRPRPDVPAKRESDKPRSGAVTTHDAGAHDKPAAPAPRPSESKPAKPDAHDRDTRDKPSTLEKFLSEAKPAPPPAPAASRDKADKPERSDKSQKSDKPEKPRKPKRPDKGDNGPGFESNSQ